MCHVHVHIACAEHRCSSKSHGRGPVPRITIRPPRVSPSAEKWRPSRYSSLRGTKFPRSASCCCFSSHPYLPSIVTAQHGKRPRECFCVPATLEIERLFQNSGSSSTLKFTIYRGSRTYTPAASLFSP